MKLQIVFCFLFTAGAFAQEHFSGINTSKRTGLLNAVLNPAELANLENDYEINVLNFSANIANNKIKFSDLTKSNNSFEEMLFSGNEAANLRLDADILGPGFGFKYNKWAFAVTSAAKIKANMVNVDTKLGSALTSKNINPVLGASIISSSNNQRASATAWGEIGIAAARKIYDDGINVLSAGISFNILFPGSFANMSANQFRGNITYADDNLYLTDAQANLNLAYSGSLGDDFTDAKNFTNFFGGGINGFSTDIGINYQLLDKTSQQGYWLNSGLSIRNLGSMTFKNNNNISNTYNLNITGDERFNLNEFEDVTTIDDVERILLESGYATLTQTKKDFKVLLPAMISVYADAKVYTDFYVTAYIQQKFKNDENNNQIAFQNTVTLIPRYSTRWFEAYMPFSHNEIAGFTAGVGFRISGFFIGSGSIISAAVTKTNQADAYIGYRIGF